MIPRIRSALCLRPRSFFALAFAAVAGSAAGCSSAGPSGDVTVESASEALRVRVQTLVDPPSRGTMSAELTVTDLTTGAPADGLVVAVVPWMPAMGHGASVVPTVSAEGGGKYRIDDLVLFMPGTWELRLTFSGTTTDHADPEFDVP